MMGLSVDGGCGMAGEGCSGLWLYSAGEGS